MTKRERQLVERRLLGRSVVAVTWNLFDGEQDGSHAIPSQQPTLTLDNGARLRFSVDETEIGEYGVALHVDPPQRPGKPAKP